MRRIALAGAVLAALAATPGCGPNHHTRQFAASAAGGPAQPPTRIQGALDPDLRLADGDAALDPDAPPAEVPDSVMLRGSLDDGYRDTLTPNF
jgi:hypothetical protein